MLSFGKGAKKPATKAPAKEIKRLLLVTLVEARDLIACNNDGTSDPYVLLSIAVNDADLKDEKKPMSSIKKKTIHPEWNESFTFGDNSNMRMESDTYTLILRIFHKRSFISSDEMIGIVRVPLLTIDAMGEEADSWYDLSVENTRIKNVSGQIHLKVKFNGPPPASLRIKRDLEKGGVATEDLLSLTEDPLLSDDEGNLTYPNDLTVVVCQARDLLEKDGFLERGPYDPLIKLKIEGHKSLKTTVKQKERNPVWNEKVHWEAPVYDGSLSLTCHVKHYTALGTTVDLGTVILSLSNYSDQMPARRWYKIMNKSGVDDGIKRGEVELVIHWTYNKAKTQKKRGRFMKWILRESDTESGEDAPDQEEEIVEPPETAQEKEAKEKALEERKKELGEVEVKTGDYQVQVHIIEARDLHAENLDGTSDPIVYINCFEERRLNTQVKKSCTSAVYDELFIFNIKNLDKEAFEEGVIKISVLDANSVPFLKEKMIGGWQIDATAVYFSKNHEIYRQWVPLIDEEDAEDSGVQGYLKVSVMIIGPGDKLYVHDEDAERAAEIKKEENAGGDLGALMLMPPVVTKEWKYLVVSIYKAEALPVMDGATRVAGATVVKSGTDAFVSLIFGGGKPIRTRTKTVRGRRAMMNPEFQYDLWYPVSVPTMTQLIKLSVWDWDAGGNELIANLTEKFNAVEKANNQRTPVSWVNLYGAPEFKEAGIVKNVQKVATKIKSTYKRFAQNERNYKHYYNTVPDKASTFKGRMLLRFAIKKEQERPLKYLKGDIKPFRVKTKKLQLRQNPHQIDYVLKAIFVSGCNLPGFSQISATGAVTLGTKKQDLRIKISVGHHELCSSAKPCINGSTVWNEARVSEVFQYPSDVKQIPDIFLHLLRENDDPVCFARLKPYNTTTKEVLGFRHAAQWVLLQEDKVVDALKDGQFPGSILLKLGFGPANECELEDVKNEWDDALVNMVTLNPYEVRVHLYQGRELMACDSNGLSDPYVVMKIKEQKQVSKVVYKSLFPSYYQTFVFDQPLPDLEFAGQVTFLVYDRDQGDVLDGDDYLGTCSINLCDAFLSDHDAILPDPTWHNLFFEIPGDGEGAIMVNVQVIKKEHPGQVYPPPVSIVPDMKKAYVEIIALGIRNMLPYNFIPMQNPFLEIEHFGFAEKKKSKKRFFGLMGTKEGQEDEELQTGLEEVKTTLRSKTSKKPHPSNPNILEKMIMEVMLPEKAIYAQPLLLKARDSRLGGFLTPVVGVGTVEMSTKIPWWPRKYDENGQEILEKDPEGNVIPRPTLHPPSYVPPGSNMTSADALAKSFAAIEFEDEEEDGSDVDPNEDAGARMVRKLQAKRAKMLKDAAENVATLDEPDIDDIIKEHVNDIDTGAGVFGALSHIKVSKAQKFKKMDLNKFFVDPEWGEDEGDQPPKWAVGREMLTADLEEKIPGTPFETYELTRGQANGTFGSTLKVTGKFKCLVRVYELVYEKVEMETEVPEEEGEGYKVVKMLFDDVSKEPTEWPASKLPAELLENLLKPQRYEVRLYALKATNLTGMNLSITGKPGNSDPYINVSLGKFKFKDRENAVDDVKECDLYKLIKIDAELPGASQLVIDVMDKQNFGSDGLIGKTIIDLEDRWFDSRWQQLGYENRNVSEDVTKARWDTKPIENRSIYVPSNTAGQGIFQCWLDILTPEYAALFPPDDVALPPKQLFELRVVIWKSKGVPPMDSFEGMSDLYVRCWPEGSRYQDTDIHWRCKKGKASWNWRMKFDVELGHNTRAMKFPYLHVQLWDKDLLKWSDCAGEVHIDLGKYYRKAYKKNIAIKLFEKKQGMQAKRAAKKSALEDEEDDDLESDYDDLPPDESDEEDSDDEDHHVAVDINTSPGGGGAGKGGYKDDPTAVVDEDAKSQNEDDVKLVKKKKMEKTFFQKMFGFETLKERKKRLKKESDERKAARKKEQDDARAKAAEEEPLLKEEEEKRKKKEEEDDDVKQMITMIKNLTGLWEDDPEDSEWLHIEKHDHNNPGKPESMGYICYSVQIWPKDKAEVMPVGSGRSEPNLNPFLPPPVGRLKFSLNPFVMGSQLCGPKLCFYFTCCLFAIAFALLAVFCSPFLNILINVIFFFG